MQSDPHRPIYHFVAPEGQIIDPNGALYWKGKYHLGPIYVKLDGKEHLVWGHAVSTDLLHWTQYPDMIDVTEGGGETDIYSGGTFLSREGVPHVIYYSAGTASNRIAYATDDDLKVWKKFKGNPALKPEDPNDPNGAGYCCVLPKGKYSVWDPEAWYDNKSDYYYQISGGMKPALFKSEDMHQWEYLGPVISGNNTMRHPFEDISCPEFFSLGEKSMLLFISHTLGAQYYIGTFANEKFTPEQHGRMNWPGGTFFAPEQLRDAKGRNIIWGWVTEFHRPSHLPAYGWSGIMSLPRVVSLSGKVTLEVNPPEEIQAIRLNEVREDDVIVQPNTETTLQAQGKSIEVKLEVASGVRSPFGVKVFASPDGREETVIRYEPDRDQLVIDFVRSSVRGPVSIPFFIMPERFYPKMFNPETYDFYRQNVSKKVSEQRAPLKLEEGETLKLDIFLDRSIIEVFANGRQVVTQIVYPELDTSTGVKVFSGKEAITVKNIQSWTMAETGPY
jgi:beta-fructofuranosidase